MAIVNFFAHEGESWLRWGLGGGVGWVTDRVRDDSIWYLGLPNHGSAAVLQLA